MTSHYLLGLLIRSDVLQRPAMRMEHLKAAGFEHLVGEVSVDGLNAREFGTFLYNTLQKAAKTAPYRGTTPPIVTFFNYLLHAQGDTVLLAEGDKLLHALNGEESQCMNKDNLETLEGIANDHDSLGDAEDKIVSLSLTEDEPPAIKGAEFEHGYALIVGVGGDLPATAVDARRLYRILTDPKRCAYPKEQVRLLTSTETTKENILNSLDWLKQQTTEDEKATVLIYYSGHGGYKPHYHLVPHGYNRNEIKETAVSGKEFTDAIAAIPAQKRFILVDSCHAGGMTDILPMGFDPSPLPEDFTKMLTQGGGTVIISSSYKNQKSYTTGHSTYFSRALREALSGHGTARQDGYARVGDIAMYLSRAVSARAVANGYTQNPVLDMKEADNFIVAYYAGGDVVPQALEESPLPVPTSPRFDLLEGYQDVLRIHQKGLIQIELRMAEFLDRRAVPLDLESSWKSKQEEIERIETKIGRQPLTMAQPTEESLMAWLESWFEGQFGNLKDWLDEQFGELKQNQGAIYRNLPPDQSVAVAEILTELRYQRVEQGTMHRTVEAIRRTLQYLQGQEWPEMNNDIKVALQQIQNQLISPEVAFEQKFELSIPVIPFLLDYKIELGASVDLGDVWQELQELLFK